MLVDDPQSVAAGGDDEAVVYLSERTEVGQRFERLMFGERPVRHNGAVRLRRGKAHGRYIDGRFRLRRRRDRRMNAHPRQILEILRRRDVLLGRWSSSVV